MNFFIAIPPLMPPKAKTTEEGPLLCRTRGNNLPGGRKGNHVQRARARAGACARDGRARRDGLRQPAGRRRERRDISWEAGEDHAERRRSPCTRLGGLLRRAARGAFL